MKYYDLIVIGGGAGGFFGAINYSILNPDKTVLILEKGKSFLSKVKISGGGRCNVTHGCFSPKELVEYYPRGNKELLGPFHQFMCGDMISWLDERGVEVKIEEDGRVFPITDESQTIIDCFMKEVKDNDIHTRLQTGVQSIKKSNGKWELITDNGNFFSNSLLIATGSSTLAWNEIEKIGHKVISPVPSLFTFNIKNSLIDGLQGVSFPDASVQINSLKLDENGPVLITHWGLSGPGILKLSAWGARSLNKLQYKFDIEVNWIGENRDVLLERLENTKNQFSKKKVKNFSSLDIPNRFWERVCKLSEIDEINWGDISKGKLEKIIQVLTQSKFQVNGKSTFKDEFVTSGGVDLKEINFKTMESKIQSGIYFAGEVLNIDAVTGGFNFQAAWTTSWIASHSI